MAKFRRSAIMAAIPPCAKPQALDAPEGCSMKNLLAKLAAVLILAISIAACSHTAPIYNVDSEHFEGTASLEQRAAQIKRAAAGLGWIADDVAPGVIQAQLNLRQHIAIVTINYTPSTFSIRYKDSHLLKYDGSVIHENYNGWIERLQKTIVAQSRIN
jgi:predicted small lipoprotein YifL